MQSPLFRQSALDRLSSPEELDHLNAVTAPREWLALLAFFLVLAAVTAWGLTGSVPVYVKGQGILFRRGGVSEVVAPVAGTVEEIRVQAGDTVRAGQTLAMLSGPDGKHRPVVADASGRVVEVTTEAGIPVSAGSPLVALEQGQQPLEAALYVPVSEGHSLKPGMTVQVSLWGASASTHGYLLARVRRVSSYPASPARLLASLRNEEVVRTITSRGPVLEVAADLERKPDGTYRRSSHGEAEAPPESGVLCAGRVLVREQRPFTLLLSSRDQGS